jgi:5-methylcytosine-specific restriction endonuclease McrA
MAKRCLDFPCPEDAEYRGRCRIHARKLDRQFKKRSPRSRKVYSSRKWRGMRMQVLREQPWCAADGCNSLALEVDHIVPIEEGGAPFERANLVAYCKKHHSSKTARSVWGRKG